MNTPLGILIVDDSALMRRLLRTLLQGDGSLQVVGEAANGREALEQTAALRPDVIIMDVRMPVMDGIQTTEHLMAYHPTPILALTASLSHYDVNITFKMLGAGALDVMEKPALDDPAAVAQAQRELIRRIKLLARVRVVTHLRGRRRNGENAVTTATAPIAQRTVDMPTAPVMTSKVAKLPTCPLTVIGASTGGPQIVRRILSQCTPPFPTALVVVQHIAEGFSAGMAEWLNGHCPLPVQLAVEGETLLPGVVYIAPDGYDLLVATGGRVQLASRQEHPRRQAIDSAMQTAAEVFGARTTGVVLTGMGRDGALGLQAINRVGGFTITQDEASCAIYGMPKAAVSLGVVDEVLAPDAISGAIRLHSEQLVNAV